MPVKISLAKSSIDRVPLAGSTPGTCIPITKCVHRVVFTNAASFRATSSADPTIHTSAQGECRMSRASRTSQS